MLKLIAKHNEYYNDWTSHPEMLDDLIADDVLSCIGVCVHQIDVNCELFI